VTTDTTIGAIKRTIIEGKLFGALIDAKVHLPRVSPHALHSTRMPTGGCTGTQRTRSTRRRRESAHARAHPRANPSRGRTRCTRFTRRTCSRKAPPPIELLYTPCLLAAGSFGNALDDESTLGQHGVLHDDLLYLRLPAPEPPPPPPKKKK
jgi:hypothetical protein